MIFRKHSDRFAAGLVLAAAICTAIPVDQPRVLDLIRALIGLAAVVKGFRSTIDSPESSYEFKRWERVIAVFLVAIVGILVCVILKDAYLQLTNR